MATVKVLLYIAISINGIIARENNEEDFISHENWKEFVRLAKEFGCMVWGSKTLEVVLSWPKEYKGELKGVRKIVISSKQGLDVPIGYTLVNSPKEALSLLEKEGFKAVLLAGGSNLNASFAKEGLIDEIIISIEPVIVGKGIPIFATENFDLKTLLINTKKLNDQLIQLHYKVLK